MIWSDVIRCEDTGGIEWAAHQDITESVTSHFTSSGDLLFVRVACCSSAPGHLEGYFAFGGRVVKSGMFTRIHIDMYIISHSPCSARLVHTAQQCSSSRWVLLAAARLSPCQVFPPVQHIPGIRERATLRTLSVSVCLCSSSFLLVDITSTPAPAYTWCVRYILIAVFSCTYVAERSTRYVSTASSVYVRT